LSAVPLNTLSLNLPSSPILAHLDSGIGLPALLTGGTWQASMGGAFTAISKSEASLKMEWHSDIVIRRAPQQPHP
jgi:hypothetical protein